MIETKIEKIIIDKFTSAFAEADAGDIQIIGVWQSAEDGKVKSLEEGTASRVLGVKVYPRTYETPTIPDAQFQVDISLVVRAEVDSTGKDYMKLTEIVSDISHDWQKSQQAYSTDFSIEDEFLPTGFNLESGDVGMDKDACIWQFDQTFRLYGIIQ